MGSNILTCDTCLYKLNNRCKIGMVITIKENDSACYRHSDLEKTNNDSILNLY